MHWILYVTQTRTMMTFVMILLMKKIIGEKFSFSQRENVNNKTIRNIYCYEHFCSHYTFFSLLVSYDMGIWNKKTTLIKINNKEKGFIQVKETIQASHQQWNIKKIMIFFRSGESPWFTRPNVLLKKLQFRIHCHGQNTVINKHHTVSIYLK
jgi:hypothetical protein